MRRVLTILLVVAASGWAGLARAQDLLWYAEDGQGRVVAAHGENVPFNPASVIKTGTSWFALERLGTDHRYTTWFGYTGSWDRATGTVHGDLVVRGGGDPDFQPENAFLVARALDGLGVRRVTGGLVVDGPFWLGWEGGPFRRPADASLRRLRAGRRLLRDFDPGRWGAAARDAWTKLCERRGWEVETPPSVRVDGPVRTGGRPEAVPLVVHHSNPLPVILKRFDVFSNNDIERIADGLGGASAVQAFLRERVGPAARLETACGLGSNRMTAVEVVRLVRGFSSWLAGHGSSLRDILPVPGCDPGPIPRMFPGLATGALARTVTCKSGTLSDTDGGVAVLAGRFRAAGGEEVFFCVAAPRSGGRLTGARHREAAWLAGLIGARGGARAEPCGAPMVFSDGGATVEAATGRERRTR